MKKILITGLIVAVSFLIIPLSSIKKNNEAAFASAKINVEKKEKAKGENDNKAQNEQYEEIFRIKTKDEIKNISAKEYISGVLAAEMPADFDIEALKAQSVAAYSFALCRKAQSKNRDYDLTDSYQTDQSYLSEEKQREKWGDKYEEKAAKINEAVESTLGQYLSFNDKPALTLYCALSSGVTNSCADVFGSAIEYLVPADCESDKLSPDYKSVFSLNEEDVINKLGDITKAKSTQENLFSDIKTSKSGLVLSLKYAGTDTTGGKIAGLLGLPSATFSIEFSGSGYTFTCLGQGHGVGMSQYSAEQMAKGGADYKEILAHFYPGTKLQNS